MIRVVGLWFLMTLLLASNVGIPVYKHVCSEDGVFTSFFVPNETHCGADSQQHKKETTCCEEETKEKGCCHNETKIYKLQEEYAFSSLKFDFEPFDFIVPQAFSFFDNHSNVAIAEKCLTSFANPPPLVFGKQLLIHHQVFRI